MAQTYTGEVRGGVVVFDEGAPPPPEGARVRVETIDREDESTSTLADRLRSVIGIAGELPADLAEQHDHYVHGTPKR